jgi:tyrosyl-tRNA synthetase
MGSKRRWWKHGGRKTRSREVVTLYHDAEAAAGAERRFDQIHRQRDIPDDIPVVPLPSRFKGQAVVSLAHLLLELGLVTSTSEARRLLKQSGVKLNGVAPAAGEVEVAADSLSGTVIQVGRRKFVRVVGP